MINKNIIPIRENKAPCPYRGNARKVYQCLDEMGDWTTESIVAQFAKDVRHAESMSRHTAVKQSLGYLTTAGYAVWQQAGRGREYKIASLDHYNIYQGKYPNKGKPRKQKVKVVERLTGVPPRDYLLGALWLALIVHLILS